MTGKELKAIRRALGLSARELGLALGYRGNPNTVSVQIRAYESDAREIPTWIARLATMFDRHGVPPAWTIAPDSWADWYAAHQSPIGASHDEN